MTKMVPSVITPGALAWPEPGSEKKKRRKSSPTKLRLMVEHILRDRGIMVEPVEYFQPWSKTRKDLFGIFDLMAVGKGMDKSGDEQIARIQVTPADRLSDHMKKLAESEKFLRWLRAGGKVYLWSLRKVGARWRAKVFFAMIRRALEGKIEFCCIEEESEIKVTRPKGRKESKNAD